MAAAMKIGPNASQFKMLTGAAIAYGLTEGGAQSDLITLTPLCLRIFKPKESLIVTIRVTPLVMIFLTGEKVFMESMLQVLAISVLF